MMSYAVVLTHNRPEMLRVTVDAIAPQVETVMIIDNASDPPVTDANWPTNVAVVHDAMQPPNLAHLWNRALETFAVGGPSTGEHWDAAFLCDDVIVPPDWYWRVTDYMHDYQGSAGSAHGYQPQSMATVKRSPDPDIYGRMCGWAFVVCGESGIRADESMRWWWCDTDIDWQARARGGTIIAPGAIATNQLPNAWTNAKPELGEQAGKDRAAFAAKWGSNPW